MEGRFASPIGDVTSGDRGLGHSLTKLSVLEYLEGMGWPTSHLPGMTVQANPFNDGLRLDEAVVGLVSGY